MKKIDKAKFKEIGKKIGLFIAVLIVFVSWFLMGVRYGRKHSSNADIVASADVVVPPSPVQSSQTARVPLDLGDITFANSTNGTTWNSGTKIVFPKQYLMFKDGFLKFQIGTVLDRFDDDVATSLEVGNYIDCYTSVDNSAYTGVTMIIRYEVVHVQGFTQEILDNVSNVALVGVSMSTYCPTSDFSLIYTNYKKEIIIYQVLYNYHGTQIYADIACYPQYFQYTFQDSVKTPSALIFYCPNINTRITNYQVNSSNGYSTGWNDGWKSGYNKGKTDSETQEFARGYEKGFEDGNSDGNSLRDVVRTAIETPVNMFKTILNWNFLGYNLFTLFSTIITVIVVVFIVKKLL